MTPDEARHLISRTGFGAAPHEINALMGMSYEQGVTQILDAMGTEPTTPMPAWTTGWMYPHDQIWILGQTQSKVFNTNRYIELKELSGWWLAEMAAPGRFLRNHAVGDFAVLAQGILLDPAMLEYLDNVSNVADAPNENLVREFLELFTLGEGRWYSQSDVHAAARMLTGYTISDVDSQVVSRRMHTTLTPRPFCGRRGISRRPIWSL